MHDMLDRIIQHKKREVENSKANLPLSEIESQARMAAAPRGFIKAIRSHQAAGSPALIAEIKKASPSKGLIRENFDPAGLAFAYESGGAACLSVLTDVPFFQGHPIYLKEVRTASTLPVLRKDFMIDTYQVVEARAWGADCILIIMAAVDDGMAAALTNMANKWGMDVLVEVHNRQELERALKLNTELIGINNRNLQSFEVKLEVTEGLAPLVPSDRIVVSESGIFAPEDLQRLSRVGVNTYLVGECLMRQDDIEAATRHLLGKAPLPQGSQVDAVVEEPVDEALIDEDLANEVPPSSAGKPESGPELQTADQAGEGFVDDFQAAVQELGALIGGKDEAAGQHAVPSDQGDERRAQAEGLSHINAAGEARMVDISDKSTTERLAVAEGFVHMMPETLAHIQQNTMKKGDVLAAARFAGIMAAKNTSDLIPLCHPLALTGVDIKFTPTSSGATGIKVEASVKVNGKTGVEMEALTAVSVACLTIYDMAKAVDKGMSFSGIRLLEKSGGRSGHFKAAGLAG